MIFDVQQPSKQTLLYESLIYHRALVLLALFFSPSSVSTPFITLMLL